MTDISNNTATFGGAPGVQMSQVVADDFALRTFGFIGDGNTHQLSTINSVGTYNTTNWTVTQWQSILPSAVALTDEIEQNPTEPSRRAFPDAAVI